MSGPEIPWEERQIRAYVDPLTSGGLVLGNLMISGFINTLYGRPGRVEGIQKVQQSIRAAGEAVVPVVEYDFYADRLVEGYEAKAGRAGAGSAAFDYPTSATPTTWATRGRCSKPPWHRDGQLSA